MKIKKLILMIGGITPGFILLEWRAWQEWYE
jgi:hypothetical protein